MIAEEYANVVLDELALSTEDDTSENKKLQNRRIIAQAIRDAYRRAADVAHRQWFRCKLPHPIDGCAYCLTAQAIERRIKELMK